MIIFFRKGGKDLYFIKLRDKYSYINLVFNNESDEKVKNIKREWVILAKGIIKVNENLAVIIIINF